LILIVFAAVALFGFAALAIDGSRVFSDRRHAQNAADTSVLAAALAKVRHPGDPTAAEAAAIARATSNGFTTDPNTKTVVEVHQCDEPNLDPPCEGLPTGADPSEYIQVVIRMFTKTTFARIIGRDEVPTVVTAVARAQMGGDTPVTGGAALAGLEPTLPDAVSGNGVVTLDIHNSGIFSNSTHPCGLDVVGVGNYTVDTAFQVVSGTKCTSGIPHLNGPVQGTSAIPYPPNYNIPAPTISCTTPSVLNGTTYSPGFHTNLNIPNGTFTFAAGDHCFSGGLSINGNTNVIADNVNFLISSGAFISNTNGFFHCSNTMIYINGGTGYQVNGSSENTCNGITFYAATGTVSWNGNPTINFTAPSSGVYKGLLIYQPNQNSSSLTINGNSQQSLTGSIIAPTAPVKINGNSGTFALSSQVTGRTITIGGVGKIDINFNPAQQYSNGQPPRIQLTK
ncbi:MAG TPA: Tad domain-containing protein, partial [Anaerolineales bacterium]|nr:Tad domain-containing protein [Anaerolineales bacterium]